MSLSCSHANGQNSCYTKKLASFSKIQTTPFHPLNYRILLIMPTIYRKWAMTKLKDLEGWIDSWKLNELFSGFGGVSAEDAWYLFALEAEHSKLIDATMVGGTIDLFNCFD